MAPTVAACTDTAAQIPTPGAPSGSYVAKTSGRSVPRMVATYVPHMRMTLGGRLGTATPEIWTNTVNWGTLNLVPSPQQLQAACDAIAPAAIAWFTRVDTSIHQAAVLEYVKLNWILATGKQRDPNTVFTDTPDTPGARNGQAPPYFQTAAVTFRTRLRRGRGHVGRVFPPLIVTLPDNVDPNSPYFNIGQAGNMASSYRNFLVAARTAIATAWGGQPVPDPIVISAGDSVTGTAPSATLITGCVVDRVPDVQHRRTNRVPRSEGALALLDP